MNFSSLDDDTRIKLLLMQNRSTRLTMESPIPIQTDSRTEKRLPVHDWGPFGQYEYLGPGTPYREKQRAGIKPRNDLDQIAAYHDSQYAWTAEHSLPGGALVTSGIRGISDYGAGSAMIVSAFNPWSNLSWKDRLLGVIAGTGLQIQGIIRLNPSTMVPMAVIDQAVY